MKLLRLAVVLLPLLLGACGGDDPAGPAADDGAVVCTIDGVLHRFEFDVAGHVDTPGWLVLEAAAANLADVIVLRLPDVQGETTIADPFVGAYVGFTLGLSPYTTLGRTGTADVTLAGETRARGTFSGTAINTGAGGDEVTITGGSFDVPLVR